MNAKPSFELVVATVGRTAELARLFESLARQSYSRFRVLLVDQNEDDRVASMVREASLHIVHLRAEPGLSRARNVALTHLDGDVVALPDDDCVYSPELLDRVAALFAMRPELDGLVGRTVDAEGGSSANWATSAQPLTRRNVWHCANSNGVFLRQELVGRVGAFDEVLGLGSGTMWCSGEETEYLVRAVDEGATIQYDPELTVLHADERLTPALGLRDGASVGYILAKHDYPRTDVARMLVRPIGGAARSLVHGDLEKVRAYAATAWGRIIGYRAGLNARRRAV